MTDKTKSQTYNFLSENKSIEDIKKQPNTTFKEKSRHGGSTFKIIEKIIANNQLVNDDMSEIIDENLKIVATNLTDNEKEQKTNVDTWTKLTNYLNWTWPNAEELIQAQRTIQEKDKKIEQLKKQIEELKLKQNNINFDKFKYNAVTIYDEKQIKNTGIEKIHEEILSIENKLFFITTLVYNDGSIFEEIIHFYQDKNEIEVMKQLKQYENINKYKDDLSLIEPNANHEKIIKIEPISIKDFLKQQQDFKLTPTKTDWKIWSIIFGITLFLLIIAPICTFVIPALIPSTAIVLLLETKIIIAISFAIGGFIFKGVSSIFENSTKKVQTWIKQKFHLWTRKIPFINKRNFGKTKAELEIKNTIKKNIENLTSNKLETRLQTQYDILKQELDNRKDMKPDKLISNNKINHNSNNLLENSIIESENNHNFDSNIKNTVNNQGPQSSTNSNHNWNKVKCLLTT